MSRISPTGKDAIYRVSKNAQPSLRLKQEKYYEREES